MADSGMKSSPADFEAMFKQHVHGNLILHGRMRGMDSMKKKKLQELERDKALFKKQYSKYHVTKRATTMASPRNQSELKRAAPKPVFVVVKNLPYSMKTWNNITDVSDNGLDLYKTDVLQTNEVPASFAKAKQRKQSTAAKLEKEGPVTEYEDTDNQPPMARRRSSTMPAVDMEKFRRRSSSMSKKPRQWEPVKEKSTSAEIIEIVPEENEPSSRCSDISSKEPLRLPDIRITSASSQRMQSKQDPTKPETDQGGNMKESCQSSATASKDSPSQMQQSKSPIITVDDSPLIYRRSRSMTVQDITPNQVIMSDYVGSGQVRSRYSVSESISALDGEESEIRPRAQTIDSVYLKYLPRVSLKKGISDVILARRNSQKGLDGIVKQRRMSLFEKLLCSHQQDQEDALAKARSSEEIRKCRYIRVPGENIYGSKDEVSLEQLEFRHTSPVTEETNSSQQDNDDS